MRFVGVLSGAYNRQILWASFRYGKQNLILGEKLPKSRLDRIKSPIEYYCWNSKGREIVIVDHELADLVRDLYNFNHFGAMDRNIIRRLTHTIG